MSRGRRVSVPVRDEIGRLTRAGHGPAAIFRSLEEDNWFGTHSVDLRTVQRVAKEFATKDDSGPWSLEDFDPDDTRLILDILRVKIGASLGKRWPTKDFARWLVRLRSAHPDMPGDWASSLAWAYRRQVERGEETRYLDMAVALEPWLSENDYDRFVVVVRGSEPPPGSKSLDALRGVLADLEILDTYEEDGMMVLGSDDLEKPLGTIGNGMERSLNIMTWGWDAANFPSSATVNADGELRYVVQPDHR